jgi:steroid 5-alpha reductase family enzyme
MDMLLAGATLYFGQGPIGVMEKIGIGLFILGSFIETSSDWIRKIWKQDPKNAGKFYPNYLNAYVQHPNYLGFLTYRTGTALCTGSGVFAIGLSLFYFMWFAFSSIPDMQGRNLKKYPGYKDYIKKTARMIPYLY